MTRKSDEKLWKICMDILRQMYEEADPPADLDYLMAAGETKRHNWFFKYYLPDSRQIGIIDTHCKVNKCTKKEREVIKINVLLGAAPSSFRKGTIKHASPTEGLSL